MTETTLTWAVPPAYIFNFFLVLGRVGAVVGTAPLISGRSVPMQVKVALSVLVSLVLVAANAGRLAPVPETWSGFVAAVGLHVVVGLVLGFAAGLAFSALQMAGQLLGMQIGFALANEIDPVQGAQATLIDEVYAIMAGLVFLVIDGHHWLMLALMQSFDLVPLDGSGFVLPTAERLALLTAAVPSLALRMAFPVMAALLVTDVALGILMRIAPQMNIFSVGFPVKIVLGLGAMAITVAFPTEAFQGALSQFLVSFGTLWG